MFKIVSMFFYKRECYLLDKNIHWAGVNKLLAIFILLLVITLYVPFIGLLASLFLAYPFIVFTVKNETKFAVAFFGICLLLSLLIGGVLGVQMALQFGLTGIILGLGLKKHQSRIVTYFQGTVTFCVALVINYLLIFYFFNVNLVEQYTSQLSETINKGLSMYANLGITFDLLTIDSMLQLFVVFTPTIFLIFSAGIVLIAELVSYPLVRKQAIYVPKWPNFSTFMLPKSVFLYYLVLFLSDIFIEVQSTTLLYSVICNFELVFQLLFYLQGISFICYYSKQKDWKLIVPIFITIFSLLLPILMYIIRLLGIIDLGFELRKLASRKK